MKKSIFIALLLMTFLVNAQERNQKKCMTTPLMVHEMRKNPEYKSIV